MARNRSIAHTMGLCLTAALALSISASSSNPCFSSTAQPAKHNSTDEEWWKHAVFYEIYPRSFADSKNTGTGNLSGITAKLDYLKDLGVDAIWITPCFPSPQVDFGYDVSDYCAIAPEYGTMEDFDRLIAEAKKRNIKIIMDLVMNHTSDKHPWFVESASSKTNPKRDWFVWKSPSKTGGPPNNWQSCFGHSAWTLDPKTNEYYYHFFYPEQPDLNWRNPKVRQAMYDAAKFWLDKGVAGFRLDAVQTIFEDPTLADNPIEPGKTNEYGDPVMQNKNNHRLPEVHEVMRELRKVIDSYPDHRVLIGETSADDHTQLTQMYGKNLDEIQLPMNFFFADVNELSAPKFRAEIAAADKNDVNGWPVYLFSNHDQRRHYVRYGNGQNDDQITKMLATLMLTLRGTPLLYYGEELGMENNDPQRVEDVKDPIGKIGWPKEKGRDGERTPMQWTAGKNAGFSDVEPWLPVAKNYTTHNVATEEKDPNSVLNYYKELIKLRRSNDAIKHGEYIELNEDGPHVLSYLRKTDQGAVLVALNFSDTAHNMNYDLSKQGLSEKRATTLLSTSTAKQGDQQSLEKIELAPFSAYVGRIR